MKFSGVLAIGLLTFCATTAARSTWTDRVGTVFGDAVRNPGTHAPTGTTGTTRPPATAPAPLPPPGQPLTPEQRRDLWTRIDTGLRSLQIELASVPAIRMPTGNDRGNLTQVRAALEQVRTKKNELHAILERLKDGASSSETERIRTAENDLRALETSLEQREGQLREAEQEQARLAREQQQRREQEQYQQMAQNVQDLIGRAAAMVGGSGGSGSSNSPGSSSSSSTSAAKGVTFSAIPFNIPAFAINTSKSDEQFLAAYGATVARLLGPSSAAPAAAANGTAKPPGGALPVYDYSGAVQLTLGQPARRPGPAAPPAQPRM